MNPQVENQITALNPDSLQRCTLCILSENFSNITFDADGVCSVCHKWKSSGQTIDYKARETAFIEMAEAQKEKSRKNGSQYDAILGFSGGKDSIYALHLLKQYGLNPLLVYYDNGYQTAFGLDISRQVADLYNVELLMFRPAYDKNTVALKALFEETAEVCYVCDLNIYATLHRTALQYKVDMIVTGSGSSEGFTKETNHPGLDIYHYGKTLYKNHPEVDMTQFHIDEVEAKQMQFVEIADYFEWDHSKILDLIENQLRLSMPKKQTANEGETNYIHYDCKLCPMTDHVRFLKRGFSRNEQTFAAMVRNGSMSRDKALKMVEADRRQFTHTPEVLPSFCQRIGKSQSEVYDIICDLDIKYHPPWYH